MSTNTAEMLAKLAKLKKIKESNAANVEAAKLQTQIAQDLATKITAATSAISPDMPDFSHLSGLERLRAIRAWKDKQVTQSHERTNESHESRPHGADLIISSNGNVDLNSVPSADAITTAELINDYSKGIDRYGKVINFNTEQQEFIKTSVTGQSCCLIGSAGTGKTTTLQGMVSALMRSGKLGKLPIEWNEHKYLSSGTPAVVFTSFTRRAVRNMARSLPDELKRNCISMHKFLQYAPTEETYIDSNGATKTRKPFRPSYSASNPMAEGLQVVVIEESSMVSVQLFEELRSSLPATVQYIFLGDINQLPPVFGSAILGYAMSFLPIIELKEVYRQALESPIIRLAHRILSGVTIKGKDFPEWGTPDGALTLHAWKKRLTPEDAVMVAGKFVCGLIDKEQIDFEEDIILCPYNKSFGTIELNKTIANHLARKRGAVTFEIRAGRELTYFSAGDTVLYDKSEAKILEIKKNPLYAGKSVQPESDKLDYWGFEQSSGEHKHKIETLEAASDEDMEAMFAAVDALLDSDEDITNQASHEIKIEYAEGGTVTLNTSGTINKLEHGYCMTVHKSQGAEWRRVFLLLHQSHATMLQRELLYTAVTRARECLYVICEPDQMVSGITKQRIKGHNLAAKIQMFKGKAENEVHDVEGIFETIKTKGERS